MNVNNLSKEKTLRMIQIEKNEKQSVRMYKRKIKRGKATAIKSNQMFDQFYVGLLDYFSEHKMPVQSIDLLDYTETDIQYTFVVNGDIRTSEKVIKIFDENYCNITIIPHSKGVELFRLEVYNPGKGIGSIFMKAFNEVSKQLKIPIYLYPAAPGNNRENENPEKRRNFYHKFDFKRSSNSKYWNNENYLSRAA